MEIIIVLPLIVPFATAVLCLATLRFQKFQAPFGVTGSAVLLASGILLVFSVVDSEIVKTQIGDWPAPYGITFVADRFSAGMVLLTGFIGLAVAIYSAVDIDERRKSFGFFCFFHFMLMGLCGAFLTGDIFNFYVWFEVTLTASFGLISLGGTPAQLKGTVKYLTLNLVASAFLLSGIGLLYGEAGTLNMADLAYRLGERQGAFLINSTAMLFFVAFGIKAALFPLFFWLPASYHTPPPAVTALFAGLLTKLGMYALIRTFSLFFVRDGHFNQILILATAGASMLTGAFGALAQSNLNRLLSFSIVSQMGYILMGLGVFNSLALGGSFFFILHESMAKTSMFLIFGIVCSQYKELDIKKLGGVFQEHPYVSACFLVSGLSLAGLPPLSGFLAKYSLVRAGLTESRYLIVTVALCVAVLTLLYVIRIWQEVFWMPGQRVARKKKPRTNTALLFPAGALALASMLLGVFGKPILDFCLRAGEQLADSSVYIYAVLGKTP